MSDVPKTLQSGELRPQDKEIMETLLLWAMDNPGVPIVGRRVYEDSGLISTVKDTSYYSSLGICRRNGLLEKHSAGRGAFYTVPPEVHQKLDKMAIITTEELVERDRAMREYPPAGGGNGDKVVLVEPRVAAPPPKGFPQPQPLFAPGKPKPAPRGEVVERLTEHLNKALDAVDTLAETLPKLSAALCDVVYNLKSYAEIQSIIENLKRVT